LWGTKRPDAGATVQAVGEVIARQERFSESIETRD